MTINDLNKGFHYCMHGLGAYKGLRQTNTLEALDYWYKKGVRVFELDIAITDDCQYVAVAHTVDAPSMKRLDIVERPVMYTYDWFMSKKLFPVTTDGLTPISLQMIPSIMREYPDSIIMFDIFGFFTARQTFDFCTALKNIIDGHELNDRILVEAYNFKMLGSICEQKLEPIYCARHEHDLTVTDAVSLRVASLKECGVRFISYPWKYTEKFAGEIKAYTQAGFTVFSRTKYNTLTQQLQEAGVTVNIIAYRFDGAKAPFQKLAYYAACFKRLVAKKIVNHRAKNI